MLVKMKMLVVVAFTLVITTIHIIIIRYNNVNSVIVSNSDELIKALNAVNPGDTIYLQDGYYKGTFIATTSGNNDAPITLTGGRGAVLAGKNYGFWLKANYWNLRGFSVADSHKGIVIEGGSNNILEDLEVKNIVQEGIHFRYNSSDNILRNSYVHHTGQGSSTDQGYGEGVYLGQAVSNWIDGPDRSDRNQVLNNQIGPEVNAECIDIKEGSCCGLIQGNNFVGPESGKHDAGSWMDIKGDQYTIQDNTGSNPTINGFEIHKISSAKMGGCDNIIQNNHCHGIPSGGKCVQNNSKGCDNIINNNSED